MQQRHTIFTCATLALSALLYTNCTSERSTKGPADQAEVDLSCGGELFAPTEPTDAQKLLDTLNTQVEFHLNRA